MTLTDKEKQIAILVCNQLTNKEIASRVNTPQRAIEKHKENIMFKIDAKNQVGIAIYAIKNGMFTP